MKRIINVADRVIQKPQHVRITELFAVRAEGGDIAGKSVIEAKQPERRLQVSAVTSGSLDILETTDASSASRLCASRLAMR